MAKAIPLFFFRKLGTNSKQTENFGYNSAMRERRVSYQTLTQGHLVGLCVSAPSLQRLFTDAGLAFSDHRVSLDLVKESVNQTVKVEGNTLAELFLNWIGKLTELYDQQGYLPYRIVFTAFDGKKIQASLSGEKYEPTRHGFARVCTGLVADSFEIEESKGHEGAFEVRFFWKTS